MTSTKVGKLVQTNILFASLQHRSLAILQLRSYSWKYTGPIFDAHTHIWENTNLTQTVEEQRHLGVKSQLIIIHLPEIRAIIEEQYPDTFIFAKYLSTQNIVNSKIGLLLEEINQMREQGFSLAKMWAAPAWRNYYKGYEGTFRLTDTRYRPIFDKLASEGFPLLLHMADPDTYYATNYANSEKFGTKEEHLEELEQLLQSYPDLQFQLAHFAAQPEIHRLPHLAEWFETYDNVVVDTASSRWMARELSKEPDIAREFLIHFSTRILFGTDATLNASANPVEGSQLSPYNARFLAQRILWETNDQHTPLPFPDKDTEAIGGTFINGLNLPQRVLRNLYWANGRRLYNY
ncbi:MAG: amidohydrolase family protein [Candidatus Thorarchaeota archaeon]